MGKERLPTWEEMWASLQQEEIRRDLVKVNLNGSNGSGTKTEEEEEEENEALASRENISRSERTFRRWNVLDVARWATLHPSVL